MLVSASVEVTTHRPIEESLWNPRNVVQFSIYHGGFGRFGNILFEYASVMGIANHSNRTALFGPRMTSLQYVFPKLKLNIVDKIPKTWRRMGDNITFDFLEKFFNLPKHDIAIEGHLCSFKYFDDISSWLYKEIFSYINPVLMSVAQNSIQKVKKDYSTKNQGIVPKTVCVHVRRGDKAAEVAQSWGYRLPTALDIINAMEYMQKQSKHVVFIVTSDSKVWCYQNLPRTNIYISKLTLAFEDFVLMSNCDDMVMTVGTFGWWASWLTSQRGGTAMYYNHPFITGSELDKYLDRKDHFPADWIAYNSTSILRQQ